MSDTSVIIGLSAVLVSIIDQEPCVFIVHGKDHGLDDSLNIIPDDKNTLDALPFGPFNPTRHPTLELGLRSWVTNQTPFEPSYVEQLYTFGNKGRYAGQKQEGNRVISVGYLALISNKEAKIAEERSWLSWYDYFPWEDWREGEPGIISEQITPALKEWAEHADKSAEKESRWQRACLCFGFEGIERNEERVIDRYELLYEARLVEEALRDKGLDLDTAPISGKSMLYDHRRILATALSRLRGKIKYRPVVFDLMPDEFTLLQLQRTVEAIGGHNLHKQNFRRLVESSGLVEETGNMSDSSIGRPAALFHFRRDVELERLAPGVKMAPSKT